MVDTSDMTYNWAIAVDGSDHSMEAFNQCFKEFYEKDDTITVLSVTDKTKNYLPLKFQPKGIYDTYHTLLLSNVHPSKYFIKMIEKEKDKTARGMILEAVNDDKSTMLFLGYRGRKGEKEQATLMGSTVKNSIYNSSIPLCVVKECFFREKTKTGGYNFLACLDGSVKAYKSFQVISKLINKEKDKVICCAIHDYATGHRIKTIKERVEKYAAEQKVDAKFVEIQPKGKVSEDIIQFTNYNEEYKFHFIIFGNNGLGRESDHKKTIGSTAESLIADIHHNIIMIP